MSKRYYKYVNHTETIDPVLYLMGSASLAALPRVGLAEPQLVTTGTVR